MKLTMNVVDAFTNERFKGNSAAVIISDEWLPDELMQSIASENNLSETAFLKRGSQDEYDIRWFSPLTEIDFCGHATLASASVIFKQQPALTHVRMRASAVGEMDIVKLTDGFIQMDFPNRKPKVVNDVPPELTQGLSISPLAVLKNDQAYFAVYENETHVRQVEQTPELLKQLGPLDVVVTAPGEKFDFVSRYFWPANGGDEDPVTGSIHTGLAPYWSELLGKTDLLAYQASSRGGTLKCTVSDKRVLISGQAVHYLEGWIEV